MKHLISQIPRAAALLGMCAALATMTGSLAVAVTHSTYFGEIGKERVVAVLEFRDDRTVVGAYVNENEFNLEARDPFPLRRLAGTNPRDSVIDLAITLRGAPVGVATLAKKAGTDGGVVWSGELTGERTAPVKLRRIDGGLAGPAVIAQVSDEQFRAWLTDAAMLEFLRQAEADTKENVNPQDEWPRGGWTATFSSNLLPISDRPFGISTYGESCRCTAEVISMEPAEIALRVRAMADENDEALMKRMPRELRQRNGLIMTVPWDQVRDGDFMGKEGEAVWMVLQQTGKIEHLQFHHTFVEERMRLERGGRLVLSGRRWELPSAPPGSPEFAVGSSRLIHRDAFVVRPRWWSGGGDVVWYPTIGYIVSSLGAGDGAVAMEPLAKTRELPPKGPMGNGATEWIDADEDGGWSDAEQEFNQNAIPRLGSGKPTPRGLQIFKKHPGFVIPWNQLRFPPG